MRRMTIATGLIFIAAPAYAQSIDQCSLIPAPGNPANLVIQKLECRLQIEDNERIALGEQIVILQADKQIAEGKVSHLSDGNAALSKKLAAAKEKLKEDKLSTGARIAAALKAMAE